MAESDALKSASDAELVAAAREHQRAAFKTLFTRHRKALFQKVGGHASSDDEARDLMREAFLAIFQSLYLFDESVEDFAEWATRLGGMEARRIARNLPSSASSSADLEPQVKPDNQFWQDLWSSVKERLPRQSGDEDLPSRSLSPTLPERALPTVATPKARPRNQPRITQATEYAEEPPSLSSSGPDGRTPDAPVPEHVVPLGSPVEIPPPSLEVEVACAAATGAPVPFGAYEILGEVARGGMGIVLRARDTRLDRMVAIKVLKAGPDATTRQIRRFRREALAAARLRHPGIVTVHDVGLERGYPYLTMELVDGIALDDWILANKPPPKEIIRLVAEVARGLQHAHDCGLVHRDLKPANVLVTRTGQAKVTDFGLAQVDLQGLDGSGRLTRTGAAVGTPFYMSPEQVRGERDVDPRADIWALGIVLYECLTGTMPFTGTTVVEVYREIVDHDPKQASHWNPQLSKNLDSIIDRCMEKEREDRYLTADDVAEDLEGFLVGRPLAKPVSSTRRQRRRLARQLRKRSTLIAASLCGSLALAAIGLAVSDALTHDRQKEAAERDRALEQAKREAKSSYDQHLLTAEAGLDDARARLARNAPAEAYEAADRASDALQRAADTTAPADQPSVGPALASFKEKHRLRRRLLQFDEALLRGDSLAGLEGSDWTAAAEQYDRALSLANNHPDRSHLARLRGIDLLLINGKAQKAHDALKGLSEAEVIETGPRVLDLRVRRALALELLGRRTEAMAAYEEISALVAGGTETTAEITAATHLGHARTLLATGNPEAALTILENPGPKAWNNEPLADRLLHIDCLATQRDRLDEGRREADEAGRKHPAEPATALASARTLILMGRLSDARESLEAARKAGAGLAADLGLAAIAERQLESETARELYERIVAATPDPEADRGDLLGRHRPRDMQVSVLALSLAVAEVQRPSTAELQGQARHRMAVIASLDPDSHAILDPNGHAMKLAQLASETPKATMAAHLRHARLLIMPILENPEGLARPDAPKLRLKTALDRAAHHVKTVQDRINLGHPRHDAADLLAVGLLETRPLKLMLAIEQLRLAIALSIRAPGSHRISDLDTALARLTSEEFRAYRHDPEVLLLQAHAQEATGDERQARTTRGLASSCEAALIGDRQTCLHDVVKTFRLWQRAHHPGLADKTRTALARSLDLQPGSTVSLWILQQLRSASPTTGKRRAGSPEIDRALARNPADALACLAQARQLLSSARALHDTDPTAAKAAARESYALAMSAIDAAPDNARKLLPHQDPQVEARKLAVEATWLLNDPAAALEELERHAERLSKADPALQVPTLLLEVALLEKLNQATRLKHAESLLASAWTARAQRIADRTAEADIDLANDYTGKSLPLLDEAIALALPDAPRAMEASLAEAYWARSATSLSYGYGTASLLDSVRAAARSAQRTDDLFRKSTNNKDFSQFDQLLRELEDAIDACSETSPELPTLLVAHTLVAGFCKNDEDTTPATAIGDEKQQPEDQKEQPEDQEELPEDLEDQLKALEQQLEDLDLVFDVQPDHILALCLRPLLYLHAQQYGHARASIEELSERWETMEPSMSPWPPALFILAQAFQKAEDQDLTGFSRKLIEAVDARGLLVTTYIETTPYKKQIVENPKLKSLWHEWKRNQAELPDSSPLDRSRQRQ